MAPSDVLEAVHHPAIAFHLPQQPRRERRKEPVHSRLVAVHPGVRAVDLTALYEHSTGARVQCRRELRAAPCGRMLDIGHESTVVFNGIPHRLWQVAPLVCAHLATLLAAAALSAVGAAAVAL